jgi:hypothetical protein
MIMIGTAVHDFTYNNPDKLTLEQCTEIADKTFQILFYAGKDDAPTIKFNDPEWGFFMECDRV